MTTVVLVQQGGTGANNAADALGALGAAPSAAYDKANSALEQANAAYAAANTGTSNVSAAYDQANAAYAQANAAYGAANNAQVTVYANNASNVTTQKINFVNTSTITVAVSVDGSNANVAFTAVGGAAYDQANAAYAQANTAYGQANASYSQANLAYAAANTANLTAGGLISGTLNVTNDMIVGGNIYLQGNTTFINVSTYQVNDPLMYIAANNILTDSVDIGFVGAKNTSGVFSHTGFARDATDGKYKLFDNLADSGHVGNVIDFANTSLATLVANVEANTLSVVNGVSGNVNFDSGTLFVDSVGNRVGVGTTSPGMPLEVFTGNSTLGIRIKRFAGNYYSDIIHTESPEGLAFNVGNGTNVAEIMRITGAGNVGIGTTNPLHNLHVGDGANTISMTGVSPVLAVKGALYNTGFVVRRDGYAEAGIRSSSTGEFGTWNNYDMLLVTNGTERMRIDSNGRIGINGTAQNFSRVEVAGNLAGTTAGVAHYVNVTVPNGMTSNFQGFRTNIGTAAASFTVTNGHHFYATQSTIGANSAITNQFGFHAHSSLTGATNNYGFYGDIAAGTGRWNFYAIGTADNYFAGNVGIGTTSPDSKLAVYSATGNTQIRFGASSNYYWDISRDNDVTGSLWISNYNAVGSRTNRLVISPDGNVGVGTASPATKFHVSAGAIRLDNGYSFTWAGTGGWNGSTTGSQFFKFTDNNQYYDVYDGAHIFRRASYAESMRITSAGSVGIGTTSPSTTLDVNGTITCTTLTETSSITFKENVDPITDALNFITKLVGVTYDRKDGSAKQKAGLIAEEVNEVLPNLVQKDSDGNAYGIHYTNLIAYLVESIKELNDKIERLESNR